MRNDVTIVSALFNIERERMDGRDWEEYLKWFEVTLNLQCPMVLFITEDVKELVETTRKDLPTEIIVQEVEDIPYFHLKDQIQGILDSEEYKEKMADPDRIECKHAMYSIVQYSKFKWVQDAIDKNPHDSDYFFWLDAGGSRFFDGFDLTKPYPSDSAMESLEGMGESYLVQMNCDYYQDLYGAKQLPLDYLWDNRSYVLGSMFGGHKKALPQLSERVEDILLNEMISNGNVNNEQIALGYLIKKYNDDFTVYERRNGKHLDIFIELGKE